MKQATEWIEPLPLRTSGGGEWAYYLHIHSLSGMRSLVQAPAYVAKRCCGLLCHIRLHCSGVGVLC